MTEIDERVRLAVYEGFANTGRASTSEDLSQKLDLDPTEVASALRRLHDERHLVLDATGAIVMAHPFSATPLGFSAMGSTVLWWGGCAWDSFALPHLVPDEAPVLVATRCPGCGRALAWSVDRSSPPAGTEVAHFLVPTAHMWDDVVHTCGHQRLFCSERCVDDWLQATNNERGAVLDLETLWKLASHWYDGRMEEGYVRREPETARQYLRSVGLSGPFWGLEP